MTDEPTPFVKFEAAVDPTKVSTLGIAVRLRWWVRPSMWLANNLLRAVVKHGVKIGTPWWKRWPLKVFFREP